MKEYTTNNGTKLFYYVSYDKGGRNAFTGADTARGYYLHVQRQANRFRAFENLSQEYGAGKQFIFAVGRQSEKQAEKAEKVGADMLQDIANAFGL